MSHHDLALMGIAVAVFLALVVAIARFRLHPFPALVIGALVLGLWAGAPAAQVLASFGKGFGDTLANVGMLLALGEEAGPFIAAEQRIGSLHRCCVSRR